MPTRENRCTLTRDHLGQLGVDDLEHLVSRLRRATRRAESVRDWANELAGHPVLEVITAREPVQCDNILHP